MTRDELFRNGPPRGGDFVFDAGVAAVFDDMIVRSVPFYEEQQRMLAELVKRFLQPGTAVHDLGCATGTTLIRLARELEADGDRRLVGHDRSEPMLRQARQRIDAEGLAQRIDLRRSDLEDPAQLQLENAGVVLCCWTLQFIRPLQREALLRRVFGALAGGGALIVTEKVLCNAQELDRHFIDSYYAYKARSGYSETEIHRKREALENVLVPYRIDENRELFRRCGFQPVDTFFQWFNFAGYLCLRPVRDGNPDHAASGPV